MHIRNLIQLIKVLELIIMYGIFFVKQIFGFLNTCNYRLSEILISNNPYFKSDLIFLLSDYNMVAHFSIKKYGFRRIN